MDFACATRPLDKNCKSLNLSSVDVKVIQVTPIKNYSCIIWRIAGQSHGGFDSDPCIIQGAACRAVMTTG